MEILYPFGPPLGQMSVSESVVEIINEYLDDILTSNRDADFDHSSRLVGAVRNEITFTEDGFLPSKTEKYHQVLDHLDRCVIEFFSKSFRKHGQLIGERSKSFVKTVEWDLWIVRQFQNDYNPMHSHSKYDISGVLYTKVPASVSEPKQFREKRSRDGTIDFMYGAPNFLCDARVSLRPRQGLLLLFPSHLIHTVYPFIGSNDERRCMAFNTCLEFLQ